MTLGLVACELDQPEDSCYRQLHHYPQWMSLSPAACELGQLLNAHHHHHPCHSHSYSLHVDICIPQAATPRRSRGASQSHLGEKLRPAQRQRWTSLYCQSPVEDGDIHDDNDDEEEDVDDDDDDDEIDRRGDGCPVLSNTVEERGEPAFLHLNIIISMVIGTSF